MHRSCFFAALTLATAGAAWAQTNVTPSAAAVAEPSPPTVTSTVSRVASYFDAGLDIRFRYEWLDNLPNSGGAVKPDYTSYYRLRTRPWAKFEYENFGIYARLANEFRGYDNAQSKNEFPDELFVDNLYFDWKEIFGIMNLRFGRQDMKYGQGRVIADGTASDGSRSAYFNAAKLTTRVTEKTSFDVFGVYQNPDDPLTIGQPDYYTTSFSGQDYDDGMTESGIATYWTVNELESLPMEFYLIWKDESSWNKKGANGSRVPGRDFFTLGARLMPKFNDWFSGEAEGAYQFGETDNGEDINAYMFYLGLTAKHPDLSWKPKLTASVLYLSGDDENSAYDKVGGPTDTVTGWDPVFARYTYLGDLPVKMYGSSYRWSNLAWPNLEFGFEPVKKHKIQVASGPMYAAEDDLVGENSLYRGWYTIAYYEFPILSKLYNNRGELKGKLLAEHMAYGGYYEGQDYPDQGYFLRAELNFKF